MEFTSPITHILNPLLGDVVIIFVSPVVLFVIFTGRFKIFSEGIKESSLNCDKACKAVGYLEGSKQGSCFGNDVEAPGKFEGFSEGDKYCCKPSPR